MFISWRRLMRPGAVPHVAIVHLGGQSTKQDDLRMLVELYRSKTRFIRRNKSALESSLFKMGLWLRTLAFASALAALPGRKSGAAKSARLLYLLRSIPGF